MSKNNVKKPKNYSYDRKDTYIQLKEERAKQILQLKNPINRINRATFAVRSQTKNIRYIVKWLKDHWICNCSDYQKTGYKTNPCKHILALKLYIEIGYITIENEEIKILPITYSQNWSAYNYAQSNEIELFDKLLFELIQLVDEPDQCMGRPRLQFRDQIFCSIMKVYSQLSSRRAKCLYDQALERAQIIHSPHFNAVSKTLNKPEITKILYDLVRQSAVPLAGIETNFAVDSTGFRCSTFGRYCEEKHGLKRARNWLKVHISTGTLTNIVADVVITSEHSADSPQFKQLVENTSKSFKISQVSADAAYSSKKNIETVVEHGGKPFIMFKSNATASRGSPYWRQAFHYFQLHNDEFLDYYHKRSNVETTFSAIKKKFGENIKSKNHIAQKNEMLCKIIAYNITVLIHAMFELGLEPNFFS
jgi:transposase/predicted nucleic acid-binding Zn finger protein